MEKDDNIGHTTKNKENQKDVSLNDNEHDEQSEEDLEKFKKEVQESIKSQNGFIAPEDVLSFITSEHLSLSKNEDLTKISDAISVVIKNNPDSALDIICSFTQGCILKGEDIKDIGNVIPRIIQTDGIKDKPELAHNIINGFAEACISKGKDLTKIGNVITRIIQTDEIEENPDLARNIINGFAEACILREMDLMEIGDAISGVIQENQYCYPDKIINGFTQSCISDKKDLTKIGDVISGIIKKNPYCADQIISGFTQGCILQETDLKKIGDVIFRIKENNPNLKYNDVINDFTQTCISEGENLADISGVISEIVKNNSDSALNIVCGFTQGCIFKGEDIKDIGNVITEIIQTDGIKDNPDLVFNVINGFVQGCLTTKSDNIKEIAEGFSNSLNGMEDKIKDKLKPIFSLIVSQYFINTLTNSSNKQLSEEDKKQTETQLFECYKKLFHVEDEEKIASFKDIPLKELSDLQDEYLKEKFKKKGVSGGLEYETFLKMACNLIPKSEDNKELTVKDLEKQKEIFKDLNFIYLYNNDNIKSKEQLFHKIGLEPKDFGTRREGKFSDFSIIYCSYQTIKHGFVMIIDKTKEWDEAIKPETESIYLIDSSLEIEIRKIRLYSSLKDKRYIFNSTPTLNKYCYQENSTCWLNAMSAVGFLLEKQQECIAEQKREQQEQVEQTEQHEQQPRKPYGLSIDEILEGFDKKRDEESGKITESTPPKKELSSFEQGICDYSTEHFYPLTGISDEERDIIRELLIEKIKQNKADQRKLSTTSSRLEKSKEEQDKTSKEEISKISSESGGLNDKKFIIWYNYLKESLERFTQNTEKLKELCAKFGIKDTQLSELEQKEDLDGKKQSAILPLGDIKTSKCQEATEWQNIMQQSSNGQEQRNTTRAKGKTQEIS